MLDIKLIRENPDKVKTAMRARNKELGALVDEVLAIEETTQALLMGTDDCKEGIAAFYEKRAPQFTGK